MKTLKCSKRKIAAGFLAVVMLMTAFAGPGTEKIAAAKKKVKVSSVDLVKPGISTLTMKRGTKYRLKAAVKPKKAANKKLRYISGRPSVVSVSTKGVLKAKKTGTAAVTVKSVSGNRKAKLKVSVVKTLKKAEKVTLNKKSITLCLGGAEEEAQAVLKAEVSPKKATVKKVVYKAEDEKIVSVSKTGVVKAKKEGKTKVTAYAADGWGKKAVCEITVTKKNESGNNVTYQPPGQTTAPIPTEEPEREYVLASAGKSEQLYLDPDGEDYEGLRLVAECFRNDVSLVSDTCPELVTDAGNITGMPM